MLAVGVSSGDHDMPGCDRVVNYNCHTGLSKWNLPSANRNSRRVAPIKPQSTSQFKGERFRDVISYLAAYTPGRIVHATCDTRCRLVLSKSAGTGTKRVELSLRYAFGGKGGREEGAYANRTGDVHGRR